MGVGRSLVRILTIRCKDVSALVSAGLDQELPFSERWAMRLHLLCCAGCRRCKRQLLLLREAMHRLVEEEPSDAAGLRLSAAARERLRRRMSSP